MKHITLWRVGFVRGISLLVCGGALHGLRHAFSHGRFDWDIENMSLPTAVGLLLCAIALYILGYRTERDYDKIQKIFNTERRIHDNHSARHNDTNRSRKRRPSP